MSHPSTHARFSRHVRWFGRGAGIAGLVGGIVGLVVGLVVHWETSWFAVFELGIPSSIVGGLVGFASGAIVDVVSVPVSTKR